MDDILNVVVVVENENVEKPSSLMSTNGQQQNKNVRIEACLPLSVYMLVT